MTTRKRGTNAQDTTENINLNLLLSDTASGDTLGFNTVSPSRLLRLTTAVTGLGGMVTYWVDSANSRLCVSMRIGSEKRSYNTDTAEQFNQLIEQLTNKLAVGLQQLKKPPLPPLD